ncbi:hypothetical protein SAMN05661008_00693 [Alkalithermobacter thermoalcaliphilus JW-YL-7 = DSM 7308]|uniref:Uncharacterized protein n=1 Tax=Alkalithermobacter thermoalcaliphilus JW-YL-7 = DSM 7308 TaxID=1121328 RepID=A0A150FSM7_CLOPD|nr:hypothetical protein JWYL7_1684 [[Clostridium] paradoxum JW-YL-7 = DSM 7308]SHK69015.1 hypothetical protein SAMN05661008_00693 [[Clostridium] paradoxum JW-YL-7 = DSM 7308]
MYKKIAIGSAVIFLIVFIASFSITYINTKDDLVDHRFKPVVKNINLLQTLLNEEEIRLSDNRFENILLNEDVVSEFKEFVQNFKKVDERVNVRKVISGEGKNIQFITDYKHIKIQAQDQEEYYEIPSEYSKQIEELFEKGIFTSLDIIKNHRNLTKVLVEDEKTKKQQELSRSNLKEFSESINYRQTLKEHRIKNESKDNFYITVSLRNTDIYLQLIDKNTLGVFYKNYRTYYSVEETLYNYLSHIMRNTQYTPSENNQEQDYSWVEEIEVKDIVNNINSLVRGKDAKDLMEFLFNKNTTEGRLGEFEEKRYELTLKGNGKTQNITAYENHIQVNSKIYQVRSVDIIISAYANTP